VLLYSVDGKLVKKSRLIAGVNEKNINIADIEEGIYIYSVYSDSSALVNKGKLIILR
jgi:Secretion system C-terminal sorting domain